MHSVHLQPDTAYLVVLSPEVLDAEFTTLVSWIEDAVEANRVKETRNRS